MPRPDEVPYRHLLAAFLRDHELEILASWIDGVRKFGSAANVPDSALTARVSPLLRWLAEKDMPAGSVSLDGVAHELAAARMAEGTAEKEIVMEWSLLRSCLVRTWGATLQPEEWLPATTFLHRV